MVPEFLLQRYQWRAKNGVETSHIYKKILFGGKEMAIVLRPRFFLAKRCGSHSNLVEGFSPGGKTISVLSATTPTLRKSFKVSVIKEIPLINKLCKLCTHTMLTQIPSNTNYLRKLVLFFLCL